MAPDKQADNAAVTLDDAQLRKLAKLLLNQEEPLMRKIKCEQERAKYLKICNDAYDNVISLMDSSNDLRQKYEQDENQKDKAQMAKDIQEYVLYGVNMSLQYVRNCCLRVSYVEKLKTHFNSLVAELGKLDPKKADDMQKFTKDVSRYKECMLEYSYKCRSSLARGISKEYSSSLKKEKIKFAELVERQKNKLGFNCEFQNLEKSQKLEVYNSIIEVSGRAKVPKLDMSDATAGLALLMVTAGMVVADIFTAENEIEASLNKALSALSEKDTFAVQVGVEEEVATATGDSQLGTITISLAGLVAGTMAGLLFVTESGGLIDQILGTGGKATLNLDGLKFHTENMPDGMTLAYDTANGS